MPNSNMHLLPANIPLAYFITLRTYGTWLHGDEKGSVDTRHNHHQTPLAPANPSQRITNQNRLHHAPTLLAADSAQLIEATIAEVCRHRRWSLHAVHARTNHVHIVASGNKSPERMMNDFKAWATRRLREHNFVTGTQTVWADHGSTPYLWTNAQVLAAIEYVKNWQGGPLQKTWDEVRRDMENE